MTPTAPSRPIVAVSTPVAGRHHRQQRDHAAFGEMDRLDGIAGFLKRYALFELTMFDMGGEQRQIGGRKGGQQAVAAVRTVVRRSHRAISSARSAELRRPHG